MFRQNMSEIPGTKGYGRFVSCFIESSQSLKPAKTSLTFCLLSQGEFGMYARAQVKILQH